MTLFTAHAVVTVLVISTFAPLIHGALSSRLHFQTVPWGVTAPFAKGTLLQLMVKAALKTQG